MTDAEKTKKSDEISLSFHAKSYVKLRTMLKSLESADIAEALEELEVDGCAFCFKLIPKVRRAEIFSYIPFERQVELLEILPEDIVIFIINEMEPVDRTKLLEELPPEISEKLILKLDPDERKMAAKLLSYPEDSVGRIMTPEFIAVNAGMSVAEAIDYIRWNASRYPEDLIQQVFVLDKDGSYLGDVSLGKLFTADPSSQSVENVVGSSYVALSAYQDEGEAVNYFRKYDRNIYPVVNENNILVGVVLSEDVFDIAEEEATEDIQQFGGTSVLEDSYFQTPLITLMKKRVGWLALLFLGGIWSGTVLRNFNDVIESYTYLVFFLPLIIASGGNCGSQSASLVIRSMAIQDIDLRDWYRVMLRELKAGLGLGLTLGLLGFCLVRFFWGLGVFVGVIVAISLVGVVLFGGVAGAMLPFIMKFFKFDPAVSSSPLIASLVDIFGIIIFFNIATFIIGHFGSF